MQILQKHWYVRRASRKSHMKTDTCSLAQYQQFIAKYSHISQNNLISLCIQKFHFKILTETF